MDKDYYAWRPKYVKNRKLGKQHKPLRRKRYFSQQHIRDELAKKQLRKIGLIN